MYKLIAMVILVAFFVTGCASAEKTRSLEQRIEVLEAKSGFSSTTSYVADEKVITKTDSVTFVSESPSSSSNYTAKRTTVSLSKKDVQRALKKAGYYNGPIDGKIGTKSKKAIRQFQADNGLKVDGVVGTQTKKALSKYLSYK